MTPDRNDFARMEELYREWNGKINVISRKDIDNLFEHHILHSFAIADYLQRMRPEEFELWIAPEPSYPVSVLDVGTGGGFPGIPLAFLFPRVQFTLCDSIGKKTLVASEVARALGLDNVRVVNCRAEALEGQFDYIVSRAVTSLENFYPWVRGKYSRRILYLRGGDVDKECNDLHRRCRLSADRISNWPLSCSPVFSPYPHFNGKYLVDIQ